MCVRIIMKNENVKCFFLCRCAETNRLNFWRTFYVSSQADYHRNTSAGFRWRSLKPSSPLASCSKVEPQMELVGDRGREPRQPLRAFRFCEACSAQSRSFWPSKPGLLLFTAKTHLLNLEMAHNGPIQRWPGIWRFDPFLHTSDVL